MRARLSAAALVTAALALGACAGTSSNDVRSTAAPSATATRPTTSTSVVPSSTRSTPTPTSTHSSTSVSTSTSIALSAPAGPERNAKNACAFSGVGTWVDVYDYAPAFAGRTPPVTPSAVRLMRDAGLRTLYLQVAKDDPRSPGLVADGPLAGAFLRGAHALGLRVVAWYLPTHVDPQGDLRRMLALVNFQSGGQRFDGVALDIEGTGVTDVAVRNTRLVELVSAVDRAAGSMPIGAIVYPPVATDVLNRSLWPDFPWRSIASHVDVWLPMAYWTYRSPNSPYHDASRYVSENVDRLRADVGDPTAPVHVIGGVADRTTASDLVGFVRAARERDSIGVSLYDWNTTTPSMRPALNMPSQC